MFRLPFNNFQNTGWGFPLIGDYEAYLNRPPESGFRYPAKTVEGNFLASKFLLANVEAGGTEGFTWNTPEVPPRFYAVLSGQQLDGNKDTVYYRFTYSGGVFPHSRESGNLYVAYSGRLSGTSYDNVLFYHVNTGTFSGAAKDSGSLYHRVSGGISSANIGSGIVNMQVTSGFFNFNRDESGMLYCSFGGTFTAPNQDIAGPIYMVFEAIDYEDAGAPIVTKSVTEEKSVYMRLVKIYYSDL